MATAFNQTNGGETSSTQHVVQFYESDSFLINSVSEFVESIFQQLKEGKDELTFGFSEGRVKANNETIGDYFKRLNP